ncbi:MAG: hypothetical protein WC554_11330 [Clostridia bacterium]|jgi:hypothetical protein
MRYQKGHAPSGGRPKGAKSVLSEAFYNDCLSLYAERGLGGLREFVNKCPRNREIFYGWLAKWAEKQIKQAVELGNASDAAGKRQSLLIEVRHVHKPDRGNGNGNGNGDGNGKPAAP